MSKHRTSFMVAAFAALALAAPLAAQDRSAVNGTELDAAVATHSTRREAAVRELLGTAQVQQVAEQMGVSAPDLAARVAALDAATLDQLVQRAGGEERDLAGGANTLVISTTTIIIALLIIILLVD
jgi:hypothetical protein